MSSILLENNDLLSELSGTHLKWNYMNVQSPIFELTLIYIKKSGGNAVSMLLNPSITELSLTSLEAGVEYLFTIKALDASRNSTQSNVLTSTNPFVIYAPVIKMISGFDNSMDVELETPVNSFTVNDKVEFVIRKSDLIFTVTKQFRVDNVYNLSTEDAVEIVNNSLYQISCRFVPDDGSIYRVPSGLSATVEGEPSNKPNAPTVSLEAIDTIDGVKVEYGLRMSWFEPNDFDEWSSSGFTASYQIRTENGALLSFGSLTSSELTAKEKKLTISEITNVRAVVVYSNRFGRGDEGISDYTHTYGKPFKPTMLSVQGGDSAIYVNYSLNGSNGSSISKIEIARLTPLGFQTLAELTNNDTSFIIMGLNNGEMYDIRVRVLNGWGFSEYSDFLKQEFPAGNSSMTCVKSGAKQLTVVFTPNGRPLLSLTSLAIDANPSSDEELIKDVVLSDDIKTDRISVQTLVLNFNCSNEITNFIALASNNATTLIVKNFN